MSSPRRLLRPNGDVLCERCVVASTPLARMKGLLGRHELPAGEGILLRPAGSIHTAFMRFAIDVVFLDGQGTVLAIERGLRPWRTARKRGAQAVVELPAGESERRGLAVGQRLTVVS